MGIPWCYTDFNPFLLLVNILYLVVVEEDFYRKVEGDLFPH